MRMEFDVAQICLNGHLINAASMNVPSMNKSFCTTCGEPTITACQNCHNDIPGAFRIGSRTYGKLDTIPRYCEHCGAPYPWTLATQEAAIEIIALSDALTKEEKDDLQKALPELVRETPKTRVAVLKFNKYIEKAGIGLGNALRDILIDVVSEGVKKSIWG